MSVVAPDLMGIRQGLRFKVGDSTSSLVGEHNEWDTAWFEINVERTADNRPLPVAKHQRAAVP